MVDVDRADLSDVPRLAVSVEDAGLEMLWLRSGSGRRSVTAAAASCASAAEGLLIGAEVRVDGTHPLYLAEERNVADQVLGGRLVLAVDADGQPDLTAEWVAVLIAAGAPRPFRHRGSSFTIPAGLPQHTINPEEAVLVTPAPFSLEPPLWIAGADSIAAHHGLSVLAARDAGAQESRRVWDQMESSLGARADRLRRPAIRGWDPATEDAGDLSVRLVEEQNSWGLDTALVGIDAETGGAAWRAALHEVARVVRPRVQTESLPAGLEEFWDSRRNKQERPTDREAQR